MVFVKLQSDKKKFMKPQPAYYKGSSIFNPMSPKEPSFAISNHQIYLQKHNGGFINLASIIDAGKTVANIVKDNKDLISSGISTVKSLSDTAGAITDTVKKSKELEQLKTIQEIRKNATREAKKKKEVQLTDTQLENLQKLGNGFVRF